MSTPDELRKAAKELFEHGIQVGADVRNELLAFAAAWEADLAKLRAAVHAAPAPSIADIGFTLPAGLTQEMEVALRVIALLVAPATDEKGGGS